MTNLTNNKAVLSWIDEMTAITKPDRIVWITGEEDQLDELREQENWVAWLWILPDISRK